MTKKRTKSICLRLSPEEHQMVRQKARAAGLSVSALLRDHLGRAHIYNHKQTQIWLATLLSIRKVLVALAERAVVFRPADAVSAIAYLASIARQLEQFEQLENQYAHKIL
jgi:post-segregation antitoxin (ccd killing protein)